MRQNISLHAKLFSRILDGKTTAYEMTREVLLWRGFLVMPHQGELYLNAWSHEDDLTLLQKWLAVEEIPREERGIPEINPETEPGNHVYHRKMRVGYYDTEPMDVRRHATHRIMPTDKESALFRLIAAPTRNTGLCSFYAFSRGPRETREFGRRVPVVCLEPAVALLVKLLPLLRLETTYSCEGHAENDPPVIKFATAADMRWARVALPQFLPPEDQFVGDWLMHWNEEHKYWGNQWFLAKHGHNNDPDKLFALASNVQRLARNIMDSHWDEAGNYRPFQSKAAIARAYCGDKERWATPACWKNPDHYIFSKEHAETGFKLPRYEHLHGDCWSRASKAWRLRDFSHRL